MEKTNAMDSEDQITHSYPHLDRARCGITTLSPSCRSDADRALLRSILRMTLVSLNPDYNKRRAPFGRLVCSD